MRHFADLAVTDRFAANIVLRFHLNAFQHDIILVGHVHVTICTHLDVASENIQLVVCTDYLNAVAGVENFRWPW